MISIEKTLRKNYDNDFNSLPIREKNQFTYYLVFYSQ